MYSITHLNKCEVQSLKCLDTLGVAEANKQVVAEAPITPNSNSNFHFNCVKRPLKVCCFDSINETNEDLCASIGDTSPKTPNGGVFDPFPLCKKYVEEMGTNVAQRLNGICVDGVETLSDEEMFESMYENLLDAIVTKQQIEGLLAQISNVNWDSDACKTPPLAPCLNGIAETCPNAPIKPSGKSRNIDLGLCRKLEF